MARSRRNENKPVSDTEPYSPQTVPLTPIVGIGASAGGIKALQEFFEILPAQVGAAFVVVVHLDPSVRSELAQILATRSRMPVMQVTETTELKADSIYVIPPDRQLRITDNEIAALPFDEPRGHRTPIDYFFRSLADQHGDGFAIVLSGAGSDGALGVKAVKETGGIILVQDPEEAEYPSMPRSAIATGSADFVLSVHELPARLMELIRTKLHVAGLRIDDEEAQLRRILAHVRVRTGHDFLRYKRSTVMRRVLRRMQISRRENLESYFNLLRDDGEEAQFLLADLLISVTTFFRDPKAFEALAEQVIPHLFEGKERGGPLRVWVAGCATGEEAYSIAILLQEEAARREVRPEIQVFASDLDLKALAVAREGLYPAAIQADVSEERLRRFFTREGDDGYRVKRDLRDMILFAGHSLLRDPPFSRLDLISSRNLLIYLDRELQQEVLNSLHYGLNADGYLFLGSSESAEHADGLFRAIDRGARIYQSTGRSRERLPMMPRQPGTPADAGVAAFASLPAPIRARDVQAAHREALEVLGPPSILVDDTLRVLHLSESAGRYLQPSGGPMTSDATELMRQELRFDVRRALHRAIERKETTLTPEIAVDFNGDGRRVFAMVKPLLSPDPARPKRALIMFIEGETEFRTLPGTEQHSSGEPIGQLRQELEQAQSRQRTTREEFEATNEELRAANEELQSINEEYRSTAEELETSKEELQSINEELQTLNSELKHKLETVSRTNSDLQNLMAATDFATLFLDPALGIKRFTPRLADLFSITPGDVGRPITDFTNQFDYDIAGDAHQVLQNLVPIEREIRSRKGVWYLARFRPYRTIDDKIDGVVATFLDVTERRSVLEALRKSEDSLLRENRLVEVSRAPTFSWDFDTETLLQWNRGSEELYGYSKEDALGRRKTELLRTRVPGSSFQRVKETLLQQGVWKGELNQITKAGRHITVESQIELVTFGERRYVLESTRDVTLSKAWDARQQLLLRELTHRVKNTLTVVQSLVNQTWRNSRSTEDFIERVGGRISALANSHMLLVESQWLGASLRELVKSQMSAYIGQDPARLEMTGDPVNLPPDLATPFGLVLHELATNAAKYGALSNEEGVVSLSWRVSGNETPMLLVTWRESAGPAVKEPTSTGFGSRLIQIGLPGADVRHEFRADGVVCTIEVPLAASGDDDPKI